MQLFKKINKMFKNITNSRFFPFSSDVTISTRVAQRRTLDELNDRTDMCMFVINTMREVCEDKQPKTVYTEEYDKHVDLDYPHDDLKPTCSSFITTEVVSFTLGYIEKQLMKLIAMICIYNIITSAIKICATLYENYFI